MSLMNNNYVLRTLHLYTGSSKELVVSCIETPRNPSTVTNPKGINILFDLYQRPSLPFEGLNASCQVHFNLTNITIQFTVDITQ